MTSAELLALYADAKKQVEFIPAITTVGRRAKLNPPAPDMPVRGKWRLRYDNFSHWQRSSERGVKDTLAKYGLTPKQFRAIAIEIYQAWCNNDAEKYNWLSGGIYRN